MVTGATGFVGAAVVRALLRDRRDVRVLVRGNSNRRNLDGLAVEAVTGDLDQPASLDAAVRGCSSVFHVAADYRLWVPQPEAIYRTNVDGTRALLQAAAAAGVARVVYTSSVATLGLHADGSPADEETPASIDDMIGHYKRSKYLAEQVAIDAAQAGQHVVIVNPSAPVGPGDIRPTPTGAIVVDAATGRMPAVVDTGLNIVHVDDVATGHLLAETKGQSGRRYILGCENMSLADICTIVAGIAGVAAPRLRIPVGVVMPLAHIAEAVARLTGKAPRVTVDGVRMARKKMYFSSERARQELGYQPRPARQALSDAVSWFADNGYLS
ncbi:MAG: NAD-dependent epimerase/dehydratase family protein [Gammaproteobacteria bacterium]|nr:NAD-dependent epimerase/dehydratase family protein [Gammaproteobacteria bacterium]